MWLAVAVSLACECRAASTEVLEEDGPFGYRGDVLMTIVYGAGFNPNALLCHEAVHARVMLEETPLLALKRSLLSVLPRIAERHEAEEEAEADAAMKNVALKGLRKNVIEIIRSNKSRK